MDAKHASTLASDLRMSAATAAEAGSWALVAMAFFAVLREGVETSVFMLAAFQASGDAASAGLGAALGIISAVAIGIGIYCGGVHLNLNRFFRVTAAVLVLVAAGLVSSAIHTAHEAAWLNSLQAQAVDLSGWCVPDRSQLARHRRARHPAEPDRRRGNSAGSCTPFQCWSTYSGPGARSSWPSRPRSPSAR